MKNVFQHILFSFPSCLFRVIMTKSLRRYSLPSNPLSFLIWYTIGEGNGTPLQYSCLENPMDGGAWWAAVHGVAKSRTQLSDFTFNFHFHALKKEMATHSSVLAWRIPGTAEPGGLPSMGSHRVGHDWVTSLLLISFMHWRRKWQHTPVFLPGESQARGWRASWAVYRVYGVAQSQTRLKWLSSSTC